MKKVFVRGDFAGFGVQKRFDVIVDVLYTGDDFELGGKLNSIIGQYGISDSDKFVDSINHAFNAILIELDDQDLSDENKYNFVFDGFQNFSNLLEQDEQGLKNDLDDKFKQISEVSSDVSSKELKNENDDTLKTNFESNEEAPREISLENLEKFNSFKENFFYSNDLDDQNFDNNAENDENDENDEDNEEDGSDDDEADDITFFVPMILVCYRVEKCADFYIYNPFFKKSFFNFFKLNLITYFYNLNNCKDFLFNLKNFYNIKKYMLHLTLLNKHFRNFNFLDSIGSFSHVPISDKIFERFWEYDFNYYFSYYGKNRRRRRAFKVYYLKKRKQIAYFLKSFKWFPYEVVFKFFMFKYVFFDTKIDYIELKKKILTVYSIMFALKKKFMRRYRRRKSFKRKVLRNKLGIKNVFFPSTIFWKKEKEKVMAYKSILKIKKLSKVSLSSKYFFLLKNNFVLFRINSYNRHLKFYIKQFFAKYCFRLHFISKRSYFLYAFKNYNFLLVNFKNLDYMSFFLNKDFNLFDPQDSSLVLVAIKIRKNILLYTFLKQLLSEDNEEILDFFYFLFLFFVII